MATPAAVLAPVATVKAGRLGGAGSLIFGAVAALAAVHTVLDTFVLSEPGTHWNDHLLAGSVSLALLAIGVVAYPRLRDGGRATISLVLGVLMLEGAALAVADAGEGGPNGDDWTGFLLAPAGVVLFVLGVRLLWRSRRRTGHRFRRRALLVVAAALAAYWVVVPTAVALMATHRPREATVTPDVGSALHPGDGANERRPEPERSLCRLTKRRRGDRVSGQRQPDATGANAR